MADARRRFVLAAIDPDYGCAVLETAFEVTDVEQLRALLGSGAENDRELRGAYSLDNAELAAITERFDVPFDSRGCEVRLEPWHTLRDVPYLVHTNYELALLLDGTKKFARMSDHYPPYRHHDEDRFDRYIADGLLHKEVCVEPFDRPLVLKDGRTFEGLREVYYTQIGEEWRIPAWKLIAAVTRKTGWNECYERLEGMLYGYKEWQIDWWIARYREIRNGL